MTHPLSHLPGIPNPRRVCPVVITGQPQPRDKSNRLFGTVRLKLTYQPAAVLQLSLNLYLGENL